MAGTDDFSFIQLDDDTLQKLREVVKGKLSPQQGSLVVIFAAAASQEASQETEAPAGTDVDQLLAQLRQSYIAGELVPPIRFCVVPVKPGNGPTSTTPPPTRPAPSPRPGAGDGDGESDNQ
jgi:hypothetical protein